MSVQIVGSVLVRNEDLFVEQSIRNVAEFCDVIQQTVGGATTIFAKDQIAGMPVPADVPRLLAAYRVPGI